MPTLGPKILERGASLGGQYGVQGRAGRAQGPHAAFIKLLWFTPCEGREVGMEPACLLAFQRGSGRGNRRRIYPLPGWISCLALESQRGGRAACKVSSVLPHTAPLAPKPSISPRLTCETQGWEPQSYSVTESRFIGTRQACGVFMTCMAPIPSVNLLVPGGPGAFYDRQHHSICS